MDMSGKLGLGLEQISQLDSDLGKTNNDLKMTGDLGTFSFSVLSLLSFRQKRSLIGYFEDCT